MVALAPREDNTQTTKQTQAVTFPMSSNRASLLMEFDTLPRYFLMAVRYSVSAICCAKDLPFTRLLSLMIAQDLIVCRIPYRRLQLVDQPARVLVTVGLSHPPTQSPRFYSIYPAPVLLLLNPCLTLSSD